MISKKILFLLFLQLIHIDGKRTASSTRPSKKSVRFSQNLVQSREFSEHASSDFNFGEPIATNKKRSRPTIHESNTGTKIKLKSALKTPKKDQVIFSMSSASQSRNAANSGAFDISSQGQSKAFYNDPSSLGTIDSTNIYAASDEGPIQQQNPYRNTVASPEIIAAVGPERFWIPPNAPIRREIPGPFVPNYVGVPGEVPFDTDVLVEEAYFPQVRGLTGQRDPIINNDPVTNEELARRTGVATIGSFEPRYQGPSVLTPLNPVTPIPGGNIIDPLSPQVNNVRGPFFPDDPRNDGAYLVTNDVPPPQLVARDLEDGPYVVERVIDPIVFYDPVQGQTVVFDPLRNFTRAYNPETDPELPLEETDGAEVLGSPEIPSAQSSARINGGGLLKSAVNNGGSSPPTQPAFWILKRIDTDQELETSLSSNKNLEKSSGINGRQQVTAINGASNGGAVIFQSKPNVAQPATTDSTLHKSTSKKKKQPAIKISHYKAQQKPAMPQEPTEHFRIQLATSNPNEGSETNNSNPKQQKKVSKTDTSDDGDNKKMQVTVVYRPIIDIELGKRYEGFKAKRNSASILSPSTLKSTALILTIVTLLLI